MLLNICWIFIASQTKTVWPCQMLWTTQAVKKILKKTNHACKTFLTNGRLEDKLEEILSLEFGNCYDICPNQYPFKQLSGLSWLRPKFRNTLHFDLKSARNVNSFKQKVKGKFSKDFESQENSPYLFYQNPKSCNKTSHKRSYAAFLSNLEITFCSS